MKHTEIANELFSKRYYCSQAVLASFAEELGLTKEQALKVAACFGGGMCKAEVCGACTGAIMALGLKYGMHSDGDYESQKKADRYTSRFLDEFAEKNGSYICRELLNCDISTDEGKAYARQNGLFGKECPKLIESAVIIVDKLLNE
ncbi:MAG: C-GCAxxG-C-C family protein [Oscillospiraceae bacterium]|nr:C-GCAxxG-C-C family protein [Oscillospiraceae bacterium]